MSARQYALAVWLVTAFVIAIAAAGWAISYANQVAVMKQHHFPPWAAWVWPSTADAGALAVMLLLALGQVRSGWPTLLAWAIFAACYGVTLAANLLADPGDPLGAAAHTWPAVLAMALVFVIAHGRPDGADEQIRTRPTGAARGRPQSAEEQPEDIDSKPRARVEAADVEAAVARLHETGGALSGAALAAELGVSARTGRRRLKALRGQSASGASTEDAQEVMEHDPTVDGDDAGGE